MSETKGYSLVAKKSKTKDDLSINIAPVITFFKKNQKAGAILSVAALILIAMFFSIYFRSYPATLPVAEQWAQESFKGGLKDQVTTQVNQQWPLLPTAQKNEKINELYAQALKEQLPAIEQAAKEQAQYIRDELQNDDGQTYLLAIDPYYYWRQTRNVVDHGYGADEIINGVKWNTHKLAPIGINQEVDEYHERYSAGIYKIVRFFNPDAKLFNVFFWMPVIISALGVIPAFFIAKKKAGKVAGFVAALIVGIHPTFIGRTAAGFADTDAYNVTFPLYIFWMFLEAFEAKDLKKKALYATLTGVLTGIYSRTWGGWWYIFDFMLAVMIAFLVYSLLRESLRKKHFITALKNKEITQTALMTVAVIISSGVFVTLFSSLQTFIKAPLSPLKFTAIQNAAKVDLWPNVFTTVAELNQASLGTIVNQIGGVKVGTLYFFFACLGVIFSMIAIRKTKSKDWWLLGGSALVLILLISKKALAMTTTTYLAILIIPVAAGLILWLKDEREIDIKYAIFLSVWFVGTIYAGTQGIRFILLLVPAYAVALGIFAGQLYRLLRKWTSNRNEWITRGICVFFMVLLFYQPMVNAHQTSLQEVPSMNDTWWESLTKIKEESAKNAIINSWWDFGHWFKAIADRPVTFDGASQNTPMAHWVGHVLSTNNEAEAIGILRMLDCGSRTGFEQLAFELQGVSDRKDIAPETTIKAVDIIDDILLVQDRSEANTIITSHGLSEEAADRVSALTHCTPPEDYFITSSDMVGKAGVWGHFGSWDFKRAYIYNILTKESIDRAVPIIQELYNSNTADASKLYQQAFSYINDQDAANAWISPWPSYISAPSNCQAQNKTLLCQSGGTLGVQNGQVIRVGGALINTDQPEESVLVLNVYDQSTGALLQENIQVPPSTVYFGDNTTLKGYTTSHDEAIGLDIVVWPQNGKYKALIASPELASSMFSRLFYMEGAYTTQFEKFSDLTSPLTGERVIIWKVKWYD